MPIVRLLSKISDFIKLLSEIAASIFMMTVIVLLFAQVIMRVFAGTNMPWAEEVSRMCMIWVAMLGGSILVKENDLISVDFLDPVMPKILLRYRPIIIAALLIWLCWMLAYEGYHQAMFGRNQMLASIRIKMFWPYLAIPVGAALMLFHYFVNVCRKFAGIGTVKGGETA